MSHVRNRLGVSLALMVFGMLAMTAPLGMQPAQAAPRHAISAQQPDPTAAPAPTAAQQTGQRKRLEAPPLRPGAAGLLIVVNLALALGVVMLALALRRRQQRR